MFAMIFYTISFSKTDSYGLEAKQLGANNYKIYNFGVRKSVQWNLEQLISDLSRIRVVIRHQGPMWAGKNSN
jgi:hypothetical protein